MFRVTDFLKTIVKRTLSEGPLIFYRFFVFCYLMVENLKKIGYNYQRTISIVKSFCTLLLKKVDFGRINSGKGKSF